MSALLVSHRCHAQHGAHLAALAKKERFALEFVVLPGDPEARLAESECGHIDAAFFSSDVFPDYSRQFFSTARKAPNLRWLHVFNAGVDHPIYAEMLARGVRLTTSAGAAAEPIAQSAIAALLMLGRNFPHWLRAQPAHAWEPLQGPAVPEDLAGQTALVVGLGHIGLAFARIARAIGLRVIGVRRHARAAGGPVDELHPADQLDRLLPRANWLVLACPLTPETRGLIDAQRIARLPRGARVINVARGEILDEAALVAALRSGHLGGAYLDVFAHEPLPADSPLWDLPNVLITPHNSAAAAGNDARIYALFTENLQRWVRGVALLNEVEAPRNTPGGPI